MGFNILSLLTFCIVIPAACVRKPKFNKTELVWGTLQNGTDWPPGFSIIMSFLALLYTMTGYDASFHVAEETSNAAIVGPRAAVYTSCLGALWGWFLMLVIAYTVDVTEIMEIMNNSNEPIMGAYLQQVLGRSGAFGMLSLIIISSFFAGVSNMVIGSRINYAYSRDRVLPGSSIWSRVHPWTKTPVFAGKFRLSNLSNNEYLVWLNCAVGILLNLLTFAGPVAIGAIFSIFSIAQYVSYLIPISLRVLSRGNRLHPGPWNVGKLSLPCGIISVAWLLLNIPVLCFPAVKGSQLDIASMNWTCAVYGGTMSLALIWYGLHARHWFKGPKVDPGNMTWLTSR
jgi:amino acid transporter